MHKQDRHPEMVNPICPSGVTPWGYDKIFDYENCSILIQIALKFVPYHLSNSTEQGTSHYLKQLRFSWLIHLQITQPP